MYDEGCREKRRDTESIRFCDSETKREREREMSAFLSLRITNKEKKLSTQKITLKIRSSDLTNAFDIN